MVYEPCQPINVSRQDRFRPPHCPFPECPDHRCTPEEYRWIKKGFYTRRRGPRHRIQRFLCLTCRRRFSTEAFTTTYYLKKPQLLLKVATWLNEGCAHRQIGRGIECAHSTVTNLSVRLGKHARLFHLRSLGWLGRISEPIVFDQFETFVRSQVERMGIGTAVGWKSWFVYTVEGASYLSANRRSERRPALKQRPKQPPPRETVRSTERALKLLIRMVDGPLHLISDAHPAYPRAIARLESSGKIRHEVHANPARGPGSDKARAQARDRAMKPVDLTHKLLRHGLANHKRETLSVGRKEPNVLGRAYLFVVWRNFIKRVSEQRRSAPTPAMKLELANRPWTWKDVLAERLFERRIATG